MDEFTMPELIEILRGCASEDETVDLDHAEPDTPFADLGYDSIALLETASRVERRYGVRIDSDDLGEARSPRLFVDLVRRSSR